MKYKLVIFDFDGTLADSYPWFLSVFEDLAQRFQLPAVDEAELRRLRGLEVAQILREYKIPFWKVLRMGKHLTQLMGSQIDKILLVNGMQAVIDELVDQGVKLALVTSNAESNVRRVLGPQNAACFDFIESGVSVFGKKSKILKILKKTGISASEALSIGDEVRDLVSAHEAQVDFGAVSWGTTDVAILQKYAPAAVFDHPGQILEAMAG